MKGFDEVKSFKLLIAIILFISLLVTGCGNKNNTEPEKETSEESVESLADIPEEYVFGESKLPWGNSSKDWTPVVDTSSDFGQQKQTLSSDEPFFSHEGVELTMMPEYISEPTNLQVQTIKVQPPWEGAAVNAYDFSLDSAQNDLGVMEIRIPYPKVEDTSQENAFGAGYFNEETKKWEPVAFWLDDVNQQVVIMTDHLSIYSCFALEGEKTRYTRVSQVFAIPVLPDDLKDKYDDVLLEAVDNNLHPGQEALDLGLKMNSKWMNKISNAISLNSLSYSTEFMKDFSNALTNVGAAVSLVQVAADYNRGEPDVLVGNAMKNITSFVVSKFGHAAMQAAYVGVFAIDYSLDKLIQQTLQDRADIWSNAYDIYYKKEKSRSTLDWYKVMRRIQKESVNIEEFKKAFEQELTRYTHLFWNESESTIALYQSQAQKGGFTGGGGLNKELKNNISRDFKRELMTGKLQAVFNRLQKEHMIRQQVEYRNELEKLAEVLNRVVSLDITEKYKGNKPKYAGYYVRFGTLSSEADPKEWTGRLDKDGKLRATFTVLGHLEAGAPDQIQLFADRKSLEQGEPELTLDFTVNVPKTKITIESQERLSKLVPKNGQLAAKTLNGDDMSFALDYYFPAHHLLSKKTILIPANNEININLSGGWESQMEEGTNDLGGTWKSKYRYQVNNLNLKIKLDRNEELPVIGTKTKALRLNGTGTYKYNVTVTTYYEQNVGKIKKGKAGSERIITSRATLTSSGDVELLSVDKKIDDSQKVILHEDGIENLKTTKIYLQLKDLNSEISGLEETYYHQIGTNGKEEEETVSKDIKGNFGGISFYYKYPID